MTTERPTWERERWEQTFDEWVANFPALIRHNLADITLPRLRAEVAALQAKLGQQEPRYIVREVREMASTLDGELAEKLKELAHWEGALTDPERQAMGEWAKPAERNSWAYYVRLAVAEGKSLRPEVLADLERWEAQADAPTPRKRSKRIA